MERTVTETIQRGGFITFPTGTYAADPKGAIESSDSVTITANATPPLSGFSATGGFYDLAMKRWLPVGSGQTAPDGTAYAYISVTGSSNPTQVHIVQVASGSDRVIDIAPPASGVGWQVDDFNGKSVYLTVQFPDQFPVGVWRLDIATGALFRLVAESAGHVQMIQNGVAWLGVNNPADSSPPQLPKGESFDSLARIDLVTGVTTTWVYRAGQAVMFVALDSAGSPIVTVLPPPFDQAVPDLLVMAPGGAGIAIPAPFYQVYVTEADNGRLWFGGSRGIYYWTLATGLIKAYAFSADASLQQTITPAGHCV